MWLSGAVKSLPACGVLLASYTLTAPSNMQRSWAAVREVL
jgi:hypothetical protein